MDEIRQNILREQEARKARLSAMLNTSFDEKEKNNDDKEDEIEKEEVKKSEDDEFNKAYFELFGENLFEKAKHQVGDVHPSGKWVWTDLGNGRFDWRSAKGRKAGGAGNAGNTGNAGGAGVSDVGKVDTVKTSKSVVPNVAIQYGNLPSRQYDQSPNMRKLIDAFRISSNKYTDPEKMSITTTPKGNWELRYDGKRVSVIGSLDIDRDEFDDLGITIDSGNTSLSDEKETPDTTKTESTKKEDKKLRPVGTGTNGPTRKEDTTSKNKISDFGDFNKILDWITDDIKRIKATYNSDNWTSGFSITLDLKNDRMVIWDRNGNNPQQFKYNKINYDKLMKYLKDTYHVEITDIGRLGSPESYEFEIKPKQ